MFVLVDIKKRKDGDIVISESGKKVAFINSNLDIVDTNGLIQVSSIAIDEYGVMKNVKVYRYENN